MNNNVRLPVDDVLPELREALRARSVAVLEAAPGAGKTTRVPLALLGEEWLDGRRIIMLEPRRLAARNAAMFMARQLGEQVGNTVGYRVRGDTRVSNATRIEIVTEGVLARLRSADAALLDYGIVIFDEFHERSLHADLSLALVLQTQELLRPELRVLVMSATLDGVAVASLLRDEKGDAPVICSEGRVFPVTTFYRPVRRDDRLDAHVSRVTREAIAGTEGDVLVFLPGAAEQRRVAQTLTGSAELDRANVDVHLLHGTQSFAEQEAAIAPARAGRRKVVLATSVAETSLTIEGVRTVVDAGLTRLPRYSVRTGLTRLDTIRVSRASADQRRGRAGRVAAGWCYRLWDEHEDASLSPRTRPEILDADLSSLVLELADSGVPDVGELRWLDLPAAGAIANARELLKQLGALDPEYRITNHGRRIAALPVAPRLAHMLIAGEESNRAQLAACIAALLEERDILGAEWGELPSDMRLRVEIIARQGDASDAILSRARVSREGVERVRQTMRDLVQRMSASRVGSSENLQYKSNSRTPSAQITPQHIADTGELLALAYPDRIAMRRAGNAPRFLLRNGSGGQLAVHDALAPSEFLAVADLDGAPPEYRIVRAAPLSIDDVRRLFADQIETTDSVEWNHGATAVRATRREMLGAIVLREQRISKPDDAAVQKALAGMLRRTGVQNWPWSDSAVKLRQRNAFVAHHDSAWPDVSDVLLLNTLDDWSSAWLSGVTNWQQLESADWSAMLLSHLTWEQRAQLDALAPTHIDVPSGSRLPIDYSEVEAPVLAVRLQEVFGWSDTPRLMQGRVPLTLHLLSPAHRPVQVTRDLAGFWAKSYFEVRKEMRGRYPRHPWPEDPLTAQATRRAKPRGT